MIHRTWGRLCRGATCYVSLFFTIGGGFPQVGISQDTAGFASSAPQSAILSAPTPHASPQNVGGFRNYSVPHQSPLTPAAPGPIQAIPPGPLPPAPSVATPETNLPQAKGDFATVPSGSLISPAAWGASGTVPNSEPFASPPSLSHVSQTTASSFFGRPENLFPTQPVSPPVLPPQTSLEAGLPLPHPPVAASDVPQPDVFSTSDGTIPSFESIVSTASMASADSGPGGSPLTSSGMPVGFDPTVSVNSALVSHESIPQIPSEIVPSIEYPSYAVSENRLPTTSALLVGLGESFSTPAGLLPEEGFRRGEVPSTPLSDAASIPYQVAQAPTERLPNGDGFPPTQAASQNSSATLTGPPNALPPQTPSVTTPTTATTSTTGVSATPPAPSNVPSPVQPPNAGIAMLPNGQVPPPAGYSLTAEEAAMMDQFLKKWEDFGRNITQVACEVQAKEFDGGLFRQQDDKRPISHTYGKFRFIAPNKLSYHVEGEYLYKSGASSDTKAGPEYSAGSSELKYVCDGRTWTAYDFRRRVATQFPIPEEEWNQNLTMDGPFPLFFIANAENLKKRFYLKIITPESRYGEEVWIDAYPKRTEDARSFQRILVMLKLKDLQPFFMLKYDVNGKSYSELYFDKIGLNNSKLWGKWNVTADIPFGWKKEVSPEKFSLAPVPEPTFTPPTSGVLPPNSGQIPLESPTQNQ